MKIEKILQDNGVDVNTLRHYNCNGCGAEKGINFSALMKALPYFRTDKGIKLSNDLYLLCCLHDLEYDIGGTFIDFIKANYWLARNVFMLIDWTNLFDRILVFVIIFLGTTLFGYKHFNAK